MITVSRLSSTHPEFANKLSFVEEGVPHVINLLEELKVKQTRGSSIWFCNANFSLRDV